MEDRSNHHVTNLARIEVALMEARTFVAEEHDVSSVPKIVVWVVEALRKKEERLEILTEISLIEPLVIDDHLKKASSRVRRGHCHALSPVADAIVRPIII